MIPRTVLAFLSCAAAAFAAVPVTGPVVDADPAIPAFSPGADVSGTVPCLTGMDTVEAMMGAWTAAFQKYHPDTHFPVESRDPLGPEERIAMGPGIEELFHPTSQEYEDAYGYEPFRVKICMGAYILRSHVSAIGVYVNKANPLTQLTLPELDAIYSDERRRGFPTPLTTWGQLGLTGEWADRPIHIYGFYWRDDVTAYFRKIVMHDAPFKASYSTAGTNMKRNTPAVGKDIMAALAADPDGISFGNASYMTDQVRPLSLNDEKGVLRAFSLSDVSSGRYPLERYLYIYVNRRPGEPLDPLIKEFLRFVLSREGQDLVRKDYYFPLTAETVAEERKKLD